MRRRDRATGSIEVSVRRWQDGVAAVWATEQGHLAFGSAEAFFAVI
jgi:hypothetical protein